MMLDELNKMHENIEKILRTSLRHRRIFLAGFPDSGKSYLSGLISTEMKKNGKEPLIIGTDEVILESRTLPLIPILHELLKSMDDEVVIVEGCQVVNLLNFIEINKWYELMPELVIWCERKDHDGGRHRFLNERNWIEWKQWLENAERSTFVVIHSWN